MRFKREVRIVNSRKIPHNLGDFLNDRKRLPEFLDAIANAKNFEKIYCVCQDYLRYQLDDDFTTSDRFIRASFFDSFGNKFFIYFFPED